MKIKIAPLLILFIISGITSMSFAQKRTVAGVEMPAKLTVNDKTVFL